MSHVYLISQGFYHEEVLDFIKAFFCIQWDDNWSIFFPFCLCGGLYWLIFLYWTSSASLEWNLLGHDENFCCVLGFILLVFYWVFFIYVYKGNWSLILFLFWIFVWFGYQHDYGLIKWIWNVSYVSTQIRNYSYLWNNLGELALLWKSGMILC